MFMTVENSVVLDDPSSSVSYYTDNQSRRGFIVSVEPAAAVSSTNFATAAVFSAKNSTIFDLKESNKEIDKARLATVKKLWEITERMNILYPENWTRIAAQELALFQKQMVDVMVNEWKKAAIVRGYNNNNGNRNSLAHPTSATQPIPSKSSATMTSKTKHVINKESKKSHSSMDVKDDVKMR